MLFGGARMIFDFEKHEKMTTKQAKIIIAIIVACLVGIHLVNFWI